MPVGVGPNLLGRFRSLGAQFRCDPGALLAHALEYRLAYFVPELDSLDSHINHVDPELQGRAPGIGEHLEHQFTALRRYHFGHRALGKLSAYVILDDFQQALLRAQLVAQGGVVAQYVNDLPFDEKVHQQVFLLGSKKCFLRVVDGQDLLGKFVHVVDKGQLEMQPRLVIGLDDFSKAEACREFTFIQYEKAVEQQDSAYQHQR